MIGLVAFALLAPLDWYAVGARRQGLEAWAKPAVMVALIAATLALGEDVSGTIRAALVIAQVLSLVGDVLLLPQVDQFVGGLAAFLTGHVAYLVALLAAGPRLVPALIGAVVVIPAVAFLGTRITRGAAAKDPVLGKAVPAYIVVVGSMAVAAVATGLPWVAVGGIVFATSDSILGWERFVAPLPAGRVLVHVTYHLAQLGLATLTLLHHAA